MTWRCSRLPWFVSSPNPRNGWRSRALHHQRPCLALPMPFRIPSRTVRQHDLALICAKRGLRAFSASTARKYLVSTPFRSKLGERAVLIENYLLILRTAFELQNSLIASRGWISRGLVAKVSSQKGNSGSSTAPDLRIYVDKILSMCLASYS